ncbi:predicted protein [Botrytis cinerea T4]|uniref:Uncharacterized protein n=1 Tax=Botryotinia fuckeliana (strain T4) TaxID=999810 RepID=G2XT48_BOTF4|nr:predicted protein [Botrytis cinerea T4]
MAMYTEIVLHRHAEQGTTTCFMDLSGISPTSCSSCGSVNK